MAVLQKPRYENSDIEILRRPPKFLADSSG